VLIGDIRHRIPIEKEYWQQMTDEEETTRRVALEVPEQLLKLKNICEVILVPGNHDGALKSYFKTYSELLIEDIGVFHSHKWPSGEMIKTAGTIIAAHSHPAVALQDELGHTSKRKVWVFGEIDKKGLEKQYPRIEFKASKQIVIMPAFNDLIVGRAVNEKREFLGPLLKTDMFKIEKMEIFTLDGTSLALDFTAKKQRGREHGKRKNHTGKVQRLRTQRI
jgi:metallophosphoesterase superfamily enzyme